MQDQFPKRPFHTHGGAPVPHHKNTWQHESHVLPPRQLVVLAMHQVVVSPG